MEWNGMRWMESLIPFYNYLIKQYIKQINELVSNHASFDQQMFEKMNIKGALTDSSGSQLKGYDPKMVCSDWIAVSKEKQCNMLMLYCKYI